MGFCINTGTIQVVSREFSYRVSQPQDLLQFEINFYRPRTKYNRKIKFSVCLFTGGCGRYTMVLSVGAASPRSCMGERGTLRQDRGTPVNMTGGSPPIAGQGAPLPPPSPEQDRWYSPHPRDRLRCSRYASCGHAGGLIPTDLIYLNRL